VEDDAAPEDDDGHVRGADVEPVEQLLDVRVLFEVDIRHRLRVAGEKLLDAERTRGIARSEEYQLRRAAGDDLEAAQDEGPHEDVAQLAVGLHERHQPRAVHLDHFPRLSRAVASEAAPAREDGSLSGEGPDAVRHDELLDVSDHPHRLDAAGGDHEDLPALAHFEEDLTGFHATSTSVSRDSVHLRRRQLGEDVLGRRPEPERRGGGWARHRAWELPGARTFAFRMVRPPRPLANLS
jgi:hypothetical protein